MSRDLTGTWIVTSLSPPDGVDLMYAAIALTDSFRKDMRRLIKAGKVAAEAYGSTSITLKVWSGHTYWLIGAPENHDYFEDLDVSDWREMKVSPLAELSMSAQEVQRNLDAAVDSVTARTECEEVILRQYGGEPELSFSAYEKHGEVKTVTGSLPAYVLAWIMGEEEE
jgi:hypothetical protein